jgi:hypothetical protein
MDLLIKYTKDSGIDKQITNRRIIDGPIESQLMNNCLEFFKITSLIKYRLYLKDMPWTVSYLYKYIKENFQFCFVDRRRTFSFSIS